MFYRRDILDKKFEGFTAFEDQPVIEALKKIDANRLGFVIIVDRDDRILGVLSDGDIRRAYIRGYNEQELIATVYTKNAIVVNYKEGFARVIELFKDQSIKFIPVSDDEGRLINIVTKEQMHALLLQNIHADLMYDFLSVDPGIVDYEIFPKPWGFYKTTVLNDFHQSKVLSVKPGAKLSLQSHAHREEHWIVVHGTGIVQLDESLVEVHCGSSVFIPKGCKHRVENTDDKERLIISEVQIGDYLGEDDIIRYEDDYGRTDE